MHFTAKQAQSLTRANRFESGNSSLDCLSVVNNAIRVSASLGLSSTSLTLTPSGDDPVKAMHRILINLKERGFRVKYSRGFKLLIDWTNYNKTETQNKDGLRL